MKGVATAWDVSSHPHAFSMGGVLRWDTANKFWHTVCNVSIETLQTMCQNLLAVSRLKHGLILAWIINATKPSMAKIHSHEWSYLDYGVLMQNSSEYLTLPVGNFFVKIYRYKIYCLVVQNQFMCRKQCLATFFLIILSVFFPNYL